MPRTLSALLIALMTASGEARQALTIVAPAAPGGGWDQTARAMQQALAQAEPGVTVQVENVPGAAGTIGLARFVTAERGNAGALLVTGLVMLSATVSNGAPVTLADTTPVARLTGEYEVIVVPADSKWRSFNDLMTAFKAEPSSIAWAGGSAGGIDDLLVRMIAHEVGVPAGQANYIAFPGGGAALAALLGRQVAVGVSGYGEFAGQLAAGTLRLLAVSAPSRVAAIDAPTLREQGVALDLANWRGVVAPPGLSDSERDRLILRIERMTASPWWQAVLAKNGWEDLFLAGVPFRQFLLAEQHRIEQVVRALDSSAGPPRGSLRLTPQTLPRLALGCAVALILAVWTRRAPAVRSESRQTEGGAAVAWLMLALLVHAFVMPVIGFVPAGAALFVVGARLMGSRRIVLDIAIGLAGAAALFIIFTRGLGLAL